MQMWLKAEALPARWNGTAWEMGITRSAQVLVNGTKVVGAQASAIAAPAGGSTIDAPARAAIEAILLALRSHGLVAT